MVEHLQEFDGLNNDLFVYLVPHTPQDIFMASDIISTSKETLKRKYLNISEYNSGDEGLSNYVNLYENAEFAFCTRFHATILAELTKTPIISVGVLERIKYMVDISGIKCNILKLHEELKNKEELNLIAKNILNFSRKIKYSENNLKISKENTVNAYKEFLGV